MFDLFSDSWILRAVGVRDGKLLLTEHQTVTYEKFPLQGIKDGPDMAHLTDALNSRFYVLTKKHIDLGSFYV